MCCVQCSCDGNCKASFQGNVSSCFLSLIVVQVLRNLLPGVRSSTLFHVVSSCAFSKQPWNETNMGKTLEAKVANLWHWWLWSALMKYGGRWYEGDKSFLLDSNWSAWVWPVEEPENKIAIRWLIRTAWVDEVEARKCVAGCLLVASSALFHLLSCSSMGEDIIPFFKWGKSLEGIR